MICKKCSAEYDDALEACPVCGEITEGDLPESEENTQSSDTESEAEESAAAEESDKQDESNITEKAEEKTEEKAEAVSDKIAEKKAAESNASMMPVGRVRRTPPLRDTRKMREAKLKAQKRQKKASAAIIVIMCFVAVLAAALTALNLTTDIFDDDGVSEKVVAGIGFTAQEEKALEELLAKTFSVSRNEYSNVGVVTEKFLENIKPGDAGNIYTVLNDVNEALQTTADPADRFADENGSYAYYKLEQSRVDKVLALFGLESLRGENSRDYYYCDGFYYFAAAESKATPVVGAEIVKSRRVIDGSYYAEGYFYADKQGETVKSEDYHFVIEMTKNADTGENVYVIRKVSKSPIFGSDGKLVDSKEKIEMKKEVIEGYTDDGKLFCVYTLEFPVIEGKGEGYKNLNEFFKNAVSVYELKAKAAQQSYTEFKQNGGDESKLPVIENVVAGIVYEDEKNLSFRSDISRYTPVADGSGVYERSVEAYTFDKLTGDFVSKDDALGKNYLLIGEVLYRIYNGYEYENVLPKENEEEESSDYDDVPTDRNGIGTRIYESPWSYTQDGVTFCYLNEKGYITEVTIPADTVKRLK